MAGFDGGCRSAAWLLAAAAAAMVLGACSGAPPVIPGSDTSTAPTTTAAATDTAPGGASALPDSPTLAHPTSAPQTAQSETSSAATQSATAPSSAASAGDWPPVSEPTVIATGLQSPWSVVFYGDTPLISERDTGRILELDADGSTRAIGTVPGAVHEGEGGLLGLAIRDSDLFAYFTTADDNRIARFPLTGSGHDLALGPPTALVTGIPRASVHNGGRLAFGPDGMLYATVGDAGNPANSQSLDTIAGKILRMTPDGQAPPDNPFAGSLIYSFGHRNPQGLAWADDGTMYASEFGQNTWDELNIITPGSNYGWPEVEGIAGDSRFVDPVQQWRPADASPSGMSILGDTAYLANLRGARLREVPLADPGTSVERYVGDYGRLRTVAVTPDGALWLLTNNTDGRGAPGPEDDRIIAIPAH